MEKTVTFLGEGGQRRADVIEIMEEGKKPYFLVKTYLVNENKMMLINSERFVGEEGANNYAERFTWKETGEKQK